jgi:predicted CxxxxCH...CXXCH cytochrome family protein
MLHPAPISGARQPVHHLLGWIGLGVALGIAAGCSKARPVVDGVPACTSWTEVAPVLKENCASCHSGSQPEGGWDATSYLGAIGVPLPSGTFSTRPISNVAIAGDASSLLLTTLGPTSDVPAHRVPADVSDELREWVVECKLSYANSLVHQPGLLNPDDPNFHGKLLQSRNWDFGLCQKCHGEDFSGGAANVSCLTCHQKGPQDCTTCHSRIAEDNAHGPHLAGPTLGHDFDCAECHNKPSTWDQPGHILDANGKAITGPVPVVFGALAQSTPPGSTRAGPPTFNPADLSCTNVYCHAGSFTDSQAAVPVPKWTDGAPDGACGSCHGLPPQSHGGAADCQMCHSDINASKQLTDLSAHITGRVALKPGITDSSCTACHGGDDGNPAPPRDLEGNTSSSSPGVGAHQNHLNPDDHICAPMACGDCHLVPENVLSPGHIVTGQPPSVFPTTIATTGKAYADGAQPVWDANALTCTNTYCHGGGNHLGADTTPTIRRTMGWTDVDSNAVVCGSCHGVPPTNAPHTPNMNIFECATCHPGSIGTDGFPIVTGSPGSETSLHINGVIDYVTPQ